MLVGNMEPRQVTKYIVPSLQRHLFGYLCALVHFIHCIHANLAIAFFAWQYHSINLVLKDFLRFLCPSVCLSHEWESFWPTCLMSM